MSKRKPETKKIVVNCRYGGFSISRKCAEFMAERGNKQALAELADGTPFSGYGHSESFRDEYPRDCPDLIAAVEQLGEGADGSFAKLVIVEIPADVDWEIEEYDGREWVSEKHRTW